MDGFTVVPLALDEIASLDADGFRVLFPVGEGTSRALLSSLEMTTTPACVGRGGEGEASQKVHSNRSVHSV